MRPLTHWMDKHGWGRRQWALQLLIVLATAAFLFLVPVVLYGSDQP